MQSGAVDEVCLNMRMENILVCSAVTLQWTLIPGQVFLILFHIYHTWPGMIMISTLFQLSHLVMPLLPWHTPQLIFQVIIILWEDMKVIQQTYAQGRRSAPLH